MGSLCEKTTGTTETETVKEQEREIPLPTYSSNVDDAVKLMEDKYMYLKEIHFLEYVYSLSIFSMENATLEDNYANKPVSYSCQDPWFNEEISEDNFQVFIDNKIIKHKNLYDKLQDESKRSVFKDILAKFYKKLNDKLKRANESFTFKKYHALIPGFLFCKGQNITKIKFLFDLFAKDAKFSKTSEFTDFQYAIYLAASYVMLAVRVDLVGATDDFQAMEKSKIKELLDACQERDCSNLVNVTDNRFFGEDGKKEYFIEDFKSLFTIAAKEESLGFILTSRGIRYLLEKNNV